MFANYPPDTENTSGSRWNSPQVAAIYTSLSRDIVIAEADYQIAMQPLRPKARRTVYRIRVRLANVVDISEASTLAALRLNIDALASMDLGTCQRIGSSAERLGHD